MDKIYCFNCKYLKSENRYKASALHNCEYPDNLIKVASWLSEQIVYQVSPKKLNKDNDCKWFKKLIEGKPPKKP